jgi:Fe-coproporphyrin III synthase
MSPAVSRIRARPDHLYAELTERCNLACSHCYLGAGPTGTRSLLVETVIEMLTGYARLGGETVAFSGGEPTLHPGLERCVLCARSLGLQPTVITNGTRLRGRLLEVLVEARVTFAVSIDGARAESHDAIRGAGTFARVQRALERLAEAKAQEQTIICFTPTRRNAGEFANLARTCAAAGFRHLYVSPLEARGRANSNLAALVLDVEGQRALLTELALLRSSDGELHVETGHLRYMFARLFDGWDPHPGDRMEHTLRVAPDGNVYLTAYVDDEAFRLGNLQESSLEDCWNSARTRDLIEAAADRAVQVTACAGCPYWIVCGGGSPARAYAVHGRFDAPDDWCEAKKMFLEAWYRALPPP